MTQTFNYHGKPNVFLNGYSTLSYQISFESNANWRTKSNYELEYREGSCDNYYQQERDFEYIASNLTRNIDLVYNSFGRWNIQNKHISFYCGRSSDNKEYFFLDEVMIILGKLGLVEELFDKKGFTTLTIRDHSYDTIIFVFNNTLGIYYSP